jgi:5-formyltetrahydrofolate cyclo-ligase
MDESPAGAKAELRRDALARRDSLPPAERQAASRKIVDHLAALLEERRARSIAATAPIRSEADVLPLLTLAAARGLDTALPLVAGDELSFRRWRPGDRLAAGAFGVPQPDAGAAAVVPEMIVLPLAAFDRHGHRLGYGKGHFDRALATLLTAGSRPLLVGAGFAVQEVASIPVEAHDVALDVVVTERETLTLDHSR